MTETKRDPGYIAFISYRHLPPDQETAIAMEKRLERFRVPKEFRSRFPSGKLGKVFRDEDELPASGSLTENIHHALDASEFLIVICTPDLPKSKWCESEIRYFLQHKGRDRILAVLVSGTPEESFSPLMLHTYAEDGSILSDTEPLAANLTAGGRRYSRKHFPKESARLIAAILGCSFDELWNRERRRRTRLLTTAGLAAFAAMAVFAGVVGSKNLQIRSQNAEITAQNAEIERQNEQILAANTQLKAHEGQLLVDAGRLLLADNDRLGAAESAEAALAIGDVYTPGASRLLDEALGRRDIGTLRLNLLTRQQSPIDSCAMAGSVLFTADRYGTVRAFRDGKVLWSASCLAEGGRTESMSQSWKTAVYPVADESVLLAGNAGCTRGFSAEDGTLLYDIPHRESVDFLAVSKDGSLFALFNDEDRDLISIRSAADGEVVAAFYLPEPDEGFGPHYDFATYTLGRNFGGCFSEDGTQFLLAACLHGTPQAKTPEEFLEENVPDLLDEQEGRVSADSSQEEEEDELDSMLCYCVIDLTAGTARVAGRERIRFGLNPVFALSYDRASGSFFYARHDDLTRSLIAGTFDRDGNRTQTASLPDIRYNKSTLPSFFCEGDRTLAVSAEGSIWLFDRENGEMKGRYELGKTVTGLSWIDREEEVLLAVQEDGACHIYPLQAAEEGTTMLISEDLGIPNITSARSASGGIWSWDREHSVTLCGQGSLLLLDAADPGRVTAAHFHTDPAVREILTSFSLGPLSRIAETGDGRFCLLEPSSVEGITVTLLDQETFAAEKTWACADLTLLSSDTIFVPDAGETLILQGKKACSGEQAVRFAYAEDLGANFRPAYAASALVREGAAGEASVRSALILPKKDGTDQLFVWDNEEAVFTFSSGEDTFFSFGGGTCLRGTDVLLETGENGLVISGLHHGSENAYGGYLVLDNEGEIHTVPSEGAAMPWSILTPGRSREVFACLEEDGVLRVYDALREEAVCTVTAEDSFAGTVSLAFSPDDSLLGVLSYDGHLRIYDAADGSLFLEDTAPVLATEYGTTGLSLTPVPGRDLLAAVAEETTMHVRRNAAVYSMTHRERTADIENLAAILPAEDADRNALLLFSDAFRTRRYYLAPLD